MAENLSAALVYKAGCVSWPHLTVGGWRVPQKTLAFSWKKKEETGHQAKHTHQQGTGSLGSLPALALEHIGQNLRARFTAIVETAEVTGQWPVPNSTLGWWCE